MKMSHKNPMQGYLDHAQWTNGTEHALGVCSSVCPSDAAAAMLYANPRSNPRPPGSYQHVPAAWVS